MSGNNADFSGDIPSNYDQGLGPILFVPYAMDMAQRVASGRTASRVLETAAGSGIVTRALRDALPPTTHITATDLNAPMLDIARTKFHADENVVFQSADALALPFDNGSFDTMICQFGIMFYPDKDQSFREAHRVLASGGRYLFSVWDAHRHNAFGRIVHETIGSFFPEDPPKFFETPFGYHLIDPIKEALLAAGFGGIQVAIDHKRRPVADFSSFARGFVFGSPVVDQIRQRGGTAPSEIQDAVAVAMRRELGEEPAIVPMQAIVFEARKA